VIPCKALKAVAAQGGFAKSTKQRIKGSPPRCNKQEFCHKKHNGISNQSSKQTKTNKGKQTTVIKTVYLHVWILWSQVSLLYIPQKGERYLNMSHGSCIIELT
jgi:hypothetical protein